MISPLTKWYERHFLAIEFLLALLVAGSFALYTEVWWGRPHLGSSLNGNRQAIYSTSASIAGSLLGFALAAVSIILAVGQMPRFRLLRESSQRHQIFAIFFQAIGWLAVTTAWSLACLVADKDQSPRPILLYVLVALGAVCAARIYRCVWVLRSVTQILVK